MAKSFVITAYIGATLLGAIIGSLFAIIGRKYLNRDGTFKKTEADSIC